jgi:hypothetical protein
MHRRKLSRIPDWSIFIVVGSKVGPSLEEITATLIPRQDASTKRGINSLILLYNQTKNGPQPNEIDILWLSDLN